MQLPSITARDAEALPVLPQLLDDVQRDRAGTVQLLADVLGSKETANGAVRVLERLPVISVAWEKPRLVELPPDG